MADYFQLDAKENAAYVWGAFLLTQLAVFGVCGYVYWTISKKNDQTSLVYTELENPLDKETVKVIRTTVCEYDQGQVRQQLIQTGVTLAMMIWMSVQWGYLRPLLFQCFFAPRSFLTTNLYKVYFGNESIPRPWKTGGVFGNTTAGTPTIKEMKAKEKKDAKKKRLVD
ncbi:inorganic phosphate transporter Pho88 [Cladochytrium replicatum]|nr:inorganic phosphate transporter Pho88 [Cladochytrium replicatum]